jgi:CRISPR-associated protein Csm4
MPALDTYRLSFGGGLHRGVSGINLEETGVHVPSDTLFAALIDEWRHSGAVVPDCTAIFGPDAPFLLTSAFPVAGAVRFYPMPVDLTRVLTVETLRSRGKSVKHIRYLSEGLFLQALAGVRLDSYLFPEEAHVEPDRGLALQGGVMWLSADEVDGLPAEFKPSRGHRRALRQRRVWLSGQVPRVTVARTNSGSTIFHAGRTRFAPGCGLWFGVWWRRRDDVLPGSTTTYAQMMLEALGRLQDAGLGGERSVGYGAFLVQQGGSVSIPDPAVKGPMWLLSRYHPRSDELPVGLANPQAAYALTTVGGWLRSPDGAAQRRKQVTLAVEGSIVYPPAHPAGDVVDVRPTYENPDGDLPHAVYRYGLALGAGVAA